MTRRVTSSVHGGSYGVADDGDYLEAWARLEATHRALAACASAWTRTAFALSTQQMDMLARLPAIETAGGAAAASASATHRITRAVDACNDVGAMLRRVGDECGRLADLVARAHGLYSAAESANRGSTSKAVQLLTTLNPLTMTVVGAGVGLCGAAYGYAAEGFFGVAHASRATSWMQEGLMAGVGAHLSGMAALPGLVGAGALRGDGRHVAAAAGRISAVSGPLNDRAQGDRLVVTRTSPVPSERPVGYVDGTAAALHDLRRLAAANGDGGRTGLSYATIAISRYVRADGTNAWLVTIPGTDGQP
ncbi:alpha/beta hydrolase, partial [Bifidobacterium italicum]